MSEFKIVNGELQKYTGTGYYATIPDNVERICRSVFKHCTQLKSVTIPDSVKYIDDYSFCDCSELANITIPNSVISIGKKAFAGCSELTSVTIQDGVKHIGCSAFEDCNKLTSITIPNSITNIGTGVFRNCKSLVSAVILGNITYISAGVFLNCTDLERIIIAGSVESIGSSAFRKCISLTEIEIPGSVKSIEGLAFEGCSGLSNIAIPSKVESISTSAFMGCSSLKQISVSEENQNYRDIEGVLYNKYLSTLLNCPIGRTSDLLIPNGIKIIGNYAFAGCNELMNISFPNSITKIGDYAFGGCSGLVNISLPDSVTKIGGHAFEGCSGLVNISFPDSVTEIGESAFENCSELTEITIPHKVRAIGTNPFYGCVRLRKIRVADENPTYDSRNDCNAIIETNTNTLIAGCNSTILPNDLERIAEHALASCPELENIIIPDSVVSIDRDSFTSRAHLAKNNRIMLENDLVLLSKLIDGENYSAISDGLVDFEDLLGKNITCFYLDEECGGRADYDRLFLSCSDGDIFMMYHPQDCSECVQIDDICGDINSILNSPILKAEEVTNKGSDSEGSYTWTFYHLATIKGYVDIRWFGSSNGYYSESVSLIKLDI